LELYTFVGAGFCCNKELLTMASKIPCFTIFTSSTSMGIMNFGLLIYHFGLRASETMGRKVFNLFHLFSINLSTSLKNTKEGSRKGLYDE
jgi:hypothetical protein